MQLGFDLNLLALPFYLVKRNDLLVKDTKEQISPIEELSKQEHNK